ncbi:hypothetical protein NN561_002695 [Cricetulus griseus]
MIGEKVAPRPQRRERKGRRLRTRSQARPQPQQGRPFPRSPVLRFPSRRGRWTRGLALRDRARRSLRTGRLHLKGGRSATRTTPPRGGRPTPIRDSAGRLRKHRWTQSSDVRTR